jgi:pSer/pThr/pTyr-binding forkhead associated (FHA) protein
VDIATVLISGAVGAVTSAITAYFTSKMKVSEERKKWSRELSQRYADALATNPSVATNMARQFGIALLVIRSRNPAGPKAAGKYFLMPNSRQIVGRHASCEISLPDPAMSAHHAAFSTDGTDVYIETMGARNPTIVNDEPVEGKVRLRSGDQVTIGVTRFELLMLA